MKDLKEIHTSLQTDMETGKELVKREKFSKSIKRIFSVKGDSASNEEIRGRIISGGRLGGTNMCVLMLAIIISSVGLNTNSTAEMLS